MPTPELHRPAAQASHCVPWVTLLHLPVLQPEGREGKQGAQGEVVGEGHVEQPRARNFREMLRVGRENANGP